MERKAAEEAKQSFLYSRRWMAETPEDRAGFEAQGRKPVVRLKMPREGTLVIDDLIRGRVEFQWAREQDHVIQRTDGSCLYHLASVVDDYQFEISHVIRAEEHLSNTPRQIFILESLGYPRPQYAHLPFVAEPGSRNKLSKRKLDKYLKNKDFAELVQRGRWIMEAMHEQPDPDTFNPVIVDFYERLGFLPEAIINYLALLGWSLDETSEDFTREELIRVFSLEKVNKAQASFDPAKLMSFQDRTMRRVPIEEKVAAVLPYLERAGLVNTPPPKYVRLSSLTEPAAGLSNLTEDAGQAGKPDVHDSSSRPDQRVRKSWRRPATASRSPATSWNTPISSSPSIVCGTTKRHSTSRCGSPARPSFWPDSATGWRRPSPTTRRRWRR